ncbi:IgaA/UmoB family intracellular growth attenuator [Halopseudomonas phragmitis]|uniref:Intracellular growth attenuator protein IgaA n=1 Tax=Halopseudomonas phragmitis TaxID=1931241 RepID=A0A1V0B0R9_9GAMM|nr:intracellular growth attenuator family protein [Halopseudomonas phragmitis]AQZ93480.1 hypothetical protein BVH74_01280 [Halopseudomonas phragmitis]
MSLPVLVALAERNAEFNSFRHRQAHAAKAADRFIRSSPFIRSITAEEEEALQPYLVEALVPHDPITLRSKGVYRLRGVHSRLGEDSGDPHKPPAVDMINGLEVKVPYDARDYLDDSVVSADVVFAGHYAILLRFNDTFDIVEGHGRFKLTEAQLARWMAGEAGAVEHAIGFDVVGKRLRRTLTHSADAKTEQTISEAVGAVRILAQRPETPAELKRRKGPGLGFLSGLIWLLAFYLFAIGQESGQWASGVVALCLSVLAIWLFWFRRKRHEPVGVNLVEGPLRLLPHANPDWAAEHAVALSDKLAFTVPYYWEHELADRAVTRAEVRVTDFSCVSFNGKLSLDQERPYRGPLRWGRHLVLAIVACLGLLWVQSESQNPFADVLWGFHHLQGSSPVLYASAEDIIAAKPHIGSLIAVEGDGRCQIGAPSSVHGSYRLNCDAVRWGGTAQPIEFSRRIEHLGEMYDATLIKAHRLQLEDLPRSVPLEAFLSSDLFVVVNHAQAVDAIRNLCFDGQPGQKLSPSLPNSALMACVLTDEFLRKGFHPVRPAEEGETPRSPLISRADIDGFNLQVRFLGQQVIADNIRALFEQLAPLQAGGVLLVVEMPKSKSRTYVERYTDQKKLMDRLLAYANGEQSDNFNLEGVVTSRGQTADGAIKLTLGIREPGESDVSRIIRACWALLVLLLLLLHVPAALWKITRTLVRSLVRRPAN